MAPLLSSQLRWLWDQVATAADRRGDPNMSTGAFTLTAPAGAEERSAAVGLLDGALRAEQRRRIELADLTTRLRRRGDQLTPGAVAAHALRRPLAVRAAARAARLNAQADLRAHLVRMISGLPGHVAAVVEPATAWDRLLRAGTITRLLARDDSATLLQQADGVLRAIPEPGRRVDRRTLVPGAPHALDDGQPLAWLVLALTNQGSRRSRLAWHVLGVDIDDLTGGLLALGIHPAEWAVPVAAVLTLPPRELGAVCWPTPPDDRSWVFVTENPSVLAAAADDVGKGPAASAQTRPVRLLCTVGTPSIVEVAAIAALSTAGWRVAVRADFDAAGLFHVRTMLTACPTAVPWRMDAVTYAQAVDSLSDGEPLGGTDMNTPWDVKLGPLMASKQTAVFEEDLLPLLLEDLRAGSPAQP